jgi:hypothetical protein
MKHALSTLIVLLTLSFAGAPSFAGGGPQTSGTKGDVVSPSSAVEAIEGTTWTGRDSDGDWYQYTFLKGGQLRYGTNTERSKVETFELKENVWAQNGNLVVILIQNYSVNVGTIEGNRIKGIAWNVAGRRWTWGAEKEIAHNASNKSLARSAGGLFITCLIGVER